jgi:hypothetical protein
MAKQAVAGNHGVKRMAKKAGLNPLFEALKAPRHSFDAREIVALFRRVSESRVTTLAAALSKYIAVNLPAAFERRDGLADYRTNPYVLLTSASVMNLSEPARFAEFLFNSKLYMALETSFGKSVEGTFTGLYPIASREKWREAPEKTAESAALEGLSRQEKARRRTASVWREVDKSCVLGKRRYLVSIKSGPNTINDTQVQAMTAAIVQHHRAWLEQSKKTYPGVNELHVIVGLTYGTARTTNNKDNQILAKLLDHGFEEENRTKKPGILIDSSTGTIRIYRVIGRDFWGLIGNPRKPQDADFVFLEVLLALAKALSTGIETASLETRINRKVQDLASALAKLQFPRNSLPEWVREDFSEDELFWFATAMTAFCDEGI